MRWLDGGHRGNGQELGQPLGDGRDTGGLGVLQSMGPKQPDDDWETEQQQMYALLRFFLMCPIFKSLSNLLQYGFWCLYSTFLVIRHVVSSSRIKDQTLTLTLEGQI